MINIIKNNLQVIFKISLHNINFLVEVKELLAKFGCLLLEITSYGVDETLEVVLVRFVGTFWVGS